MKKYKKLVKESLYEDIDNYNKNLQNISDEEEKIEEDEVAAPVKPKTKPDTTPSPSPTPTPNRPSPIRRIVPSIKPVPKAKLSDIVNRYIKIKNQQ